MRRLSVILIILVISCNAKIPKVSLRELNHDFFGYCEPITVSNVDQVRKVAELETNELLLDITWSFEKTTTFAAAGESGVWIYELTDLSSPQLLQHTSHRIVSLAYSPNGTVLAAGDANGNLLIWDIASQEWIVDVPVYESGISALAFSSDSARFASGSLQSGVVDGGILSLWDADVWSPYLVTLNRTNTDRIGSINDISFDPSGTLLAAATAHKLLLLNLDTRTDFSLPDVWEAWDVEFDPSGQILAAATATSKVHGVWLWDIMMGEPLDGPELDNWVRSIAFTPSGDLLAIGIETFGEIYLWDVTSSPDRESAHLVEITHRSAPITVEKLAFSPDGKFLASVEGYGVNLWGVCKNN